jgi:2-deoxy-D-gluconate 3-dehydrogenase
MCEGWGSVFGYTGLRKKCVTVAHKFDLPIMAGALTPTEVMAAWEAGADFVKIFPCSNLGGPGYIKALKGPLPQVPMVPTGGVNLENAAAKGGVVQLTRAFANEWAARGINVNAIAPGYMATDNIAALRNDKHRNRQILERIPAGRWGEPGDLAGAAVFLCSPASDYVHGHVLVVDGGWLSR